MAIFQESHMTFDFPDDNLYHIESSPLHLQVDGFATCECIVKLQGKVTLIEAKSSTPNPKNAIDFDHFISGIMLKFRDTIAFYHAAMLRHEDEPVGNELRMTNLKETNYQLLLIIHGHREEWLPPVMDALKSKLRHVLKVWKISDTDVKVINEQIAKDKNIIVDFD